MKVKVLFSIDLTELEDTVNGMTEALMAENLVITGIRLLPGQIEQGKYDVIIFYKKYQKYGSR